MLSLVASTVSFANVNGTSPQTSAAQTRLVMTPEHKINLFVQPLAAKGQLAIWDANGQVVYTQNVALQKGFSQQFDIARLGTGTYQLTLKTNGQTTTRTFVVAQGPNSSFVVQKS